MKRLLAITALASAIVCGSAIAQDEAQPGNKDALLELTMILILPSAKTSAAVTAIIELPKESSGASSRASHDLCKQPPPATPEPPDRPDLPSR